MVDIYLAAHNILKILSKYQYLGTKLRTGDKSEVIHKPMGYVSVSVRELLDKLPNYDLYTIKYAIDLLAENNEADKTNNDDWYKIEVKGTEIGDLSYWRKKYIREHNLHKVDIVETWTRRRAIWIAVFSFVIASIASPIIVEWIKLKLWPEPNRQERTTQGKSCVPV